MAEDQGAVQDAAARLPAPLLERILGKDKPNEADRKAITAGANEALKGFMQKSVADTKPAPQPEAGAVP